ncbi:hypothetical protein M1116_03860 [Patescibacteria group bacterium]|nr:hypothetical protein [Patescibacteria group bacterium]
MKGWSLTDYVGYLVDKHFPKLWAAWLMSDFYRKHITIKYSDGKIRLQMIQHYDLVQVIYQRIFSYRAKHSYKEFINYSLRQATDGCNHIIFLINEEDPRFVQFWTRKNILYLDFPMLPKNGLAIYKQEIIDLLKSYGFKRTKDALFPETNRTKTSLYYSVGPGSGVREPKDDSLVISANFLTDVDLATEVTIRILNGILGVKPEEVDILMG